MNTVQPSSRVERQQQFRDSTRRAMLDAALELFVEHGYERVSIRSIAAKVGYSPGAIYGYFESKDDIYFALAEEGLRRLNNGDPEAPASENPLDDVKAIAQRLYDFSKEEPQLFALIFLDARVPKISLEYGRFRFMGPIWRQIESRIERCVDAGLLPPEMEPFVALRLLVAPVFGIAAQEVSKRLEPDEDVRALVADAIDVTVAGLSAGAQARARTPKARRR